MDGIARGELPGDPVESDGRAGREGTAAMPADDALADAVLGLGKLYVMLTSALLLLLPWPIGRAWMMCVLRESARVRSGDDRGDWGGSG